MSDKVNKPMLSLDSKILIVAKVDFTPGGSRPYIDSALFHMRNTVKLQVAEDF